jgi:hypothetical protein
MAYNIFWWRTTTSDNIYVPSDGVQHLLMSYNNFWHTTGSILIGVELCRTIFFQYYDHYLLQFLPIFGEKISVLLTIFPIIKFLQTTSGSLSKKWAKKLPFLPIFWRKYFKNHNIRPRRQILKKYFETAKQWNKPRSVFCLRARHETLYLG